MIRKEKLEELRRYIEELRILKVENTYLNNQKFLNSVRYNFYLNNNRVISREKLLKNGKDGSAVIILPILENQEVLVVVEPRVFTKSGVGIGFPAGYIESLEKAKTAALRELKEETGYVPKKKIYEIDSFYQDEGCSSAYNHLFIAEDCVKESDQKLDKDEIIKYMTFNYDELFELENLGYINGANSKLLLEKSKIYMKGR